MFINGVVKHILIAKSFFLTPQAKPFVVSPDSDCVHSDDSAVVAILLAQPFDLSNLEWPVWH